MFQKRIHIAPELRGVHWLNSGPLSIHSLRGNVVVLFFWDHTDIRSLHMLEYIRELFDRYNHAGLVVIGVHAPAFDFAGKVESLEKVIRERGILFPVVMDNDRTIFENYRNSETPALIIIDHEGSVRSQYRGRGKQRLIERDVQVILHDSGWVDALPLPMDAVRPEDIPGILLTRETPQIFFGYLRGSLGNIEGFNPESVFSYDDPEFYLPGRFYLNGIWRSGRHKMTLEQPASDGGYVVVKYEGMEAYALIGQEGNAPQRLELSQDGVYLTADNKGQDVTIDYNHRSYIEVDSPRLLHLVKNEISAEYTLKIASQTPGFEMYSLTFIPSVIPDLLNKN
jgi:peroxiredoxin